MAADGTVLNPGSGGETFPSYYAPATGWNWPAGCSAYLTTIATNANVVVPVDLTHGLPVQPQTGAAWAVTGTFWQATQPVSIAGTVAVSAASLPLPTGAATAANQASEVTLLTSIGASLAGTLTVSVSSLPAGLATGTKQDTGNTSLASIDGKLPALSGGSVPVTGPLTDTQLRAAAVPVTLTSTTVTGTVAVTQSGTWTVGLSAAQTLATVTMVGTLTSITNVVHVDDNSGSLTVDAPVGTPVFVRLSDGSAVITTLPVSVAGLPLPTGAATAAKQPALGTAGTASADVITVQGKSGMTAVVVDGSAVTQPVSGTFWQTTQPVSGTVAFSNTTVAVTNAGTFAVQVSSALPAGTNVIGHVIVDSGTITTVSTVTSLSQWAGTAIDTNSGTKSAGTLRVVLATDQPALTNKLLVTPDANSAVNLAQVGGSATVTGHGTASGALRVELPTDGTGLVTAAQSGTWTVQPGTTGKWASTYSFLSTASVQAAAVKASAGVLGGMVFFNNSGTIAYVRLYNQTASPGTSDTPVFRAMVPADTTGAGFSIPIPDGLTFSTGIGIRVSAAAADNDGTALAANVVMGNLYYT